MNIARESYEENKDTPRVKIDVPVHAHPVDGWIVEGVAAVETRQPDSGKNNTVVVGYRRREAHFAHTPKV